MRLKKSSFRFKNLILLITVSLLPFIALFAYNTTVTRNIYRTQLTQEGNSSLDQKIASFDNTISHLKNLITAFIFSTYENQSCVLDICSDEGKDPDLSMYERLSHERKFTYLANNLMGTDDSVSGVYLFNESGYTYSYMKNHELGLDIDYQNSLWYKSLTADNNFETTMVVSTNENSAVLIMGRTFSSGNNKSVMLIVCQNSVLADLASDTGVSIFDGQSPLFSQGIGKIPSGLVKQMADQKDGVFITRQQDEYAYAYRTMESTGWQILTQVSVGNVIKVYELNRNILLILVLLITALIIFIIFLWDRQIIEPILKLAEIMEHGDDFRVVTDKNFIRKDEIGTLYRGYNEKIDRINKLVEEKYVSEINYLRSRLQNLMSQINAHFIFNTLENISSLAWLSGNQKIETMSKALGDILRYSIDYEKDEETLRAEIDHGRQYIKIQEVKFENAIQMDEDIDPDLYNAKVPKFLLQPIIENSIEHGLPDIDESWRIHISASKADRNLIIYVEDNGTGMSDEVFYKCTNKLQRVTAETENISDENSIGLVNINRRIKLLYSNEYGLQVERPDHGGIRIIICIPYHI